MRRFLLPSLLLLLTVVAVARMGLPLIQQGSETELASTQANELNGVASGGVDGGQLMGSLADQLIPSAEAAATMAIAEESFSPPAERELLESLRTTRAKLTAMEKSLSEREKEAEIAENRAAERIVELEKLEARIQDLLLQEQGINDKKIKRLTAVYEGMKPDKAAPVIEQMKLATVVKMFSRMDEKKVGKILSFLPAEKAVIISQALTKQISKIEP